MPNLQCSFAAALIVKVRQGILFLNFIRFPAELESVAVTDRETSVGVCTISSLLVIARVVSFLETNFANQSKRRFPGELLNIPSIVRIACFVANVDFTIRLKQLPRIAKEPLHQLPMQAKIRTKR
jgi:hypothetical protein